jgi:hypothetical protein
MFRRDVFYEVGGYDPTFKIAYDYDLWIKLLEKGEIENIPKVMLDYRISFKSLSNYNGLATVNEIQLASSRGIYSLLSKEVRKQPKAAVMGTLRACKNYIDNIAPATGLSAYELSYRNWQTKLSNAIKEIKAGKLDALIILEDKNSKNIIEKYAKNHLKLNENVFVLYNIL